MADYKYYWLHIQRGINVTTNGPFDSILNAELWRDPYYDQPDLPATEPVPGGDWDESDTDTWILLQILGDLVSVD